MSSAPRRRPFRMVEFFAAVALALVVAGGCSGRRDAGRRDSHVVFAIPDDFRLSMLRFERRLEAHDVEGTLRSFDPVAYPDYREMEKTFLAFARRTDAIEFEWRITNVTEKEGFREFEVPWTMTFLDVLHGHRVIRRGVTDFRWSHHVVPRIIGLGRRMPFSLK